MAITLFLSLPSKRVPTSTSFLSCAITPDSFQKWPFSAELWRYFLSLLFVLSLYILTDMSPDWLLALTLCMCTSIHINFWCIYSFEHYLILGAFKSILSQSRCSSEPKVFSLLRGSECPPDPLALLMLTTLAFLLIMFTPGIMYVFYLILFPADFSDIHPRYNKTWDKSVQPRKVIYLISLSNKGSTIYRK